MSSKIEFASASEIITPQVPCGLAGYFTLREWNQVLDDLEVRVLLFRQRGILSGIIQYDLLGTEREIIKLVLAEIKSLGLTEKNTIFTATHTHTAPVLSSDRVGFNPDYLPFAAKQTVKAVKAAITRFESGEIYYGKTADLRFIFNRRYWMKNGSVLTNPGKLNPQILRPEGEIDPEIPLFVIKNQDKIKVVLANVVNHSDTVGGFGVSADWPGFTRRKLMKELPDCQMVMPLVGCAGNINHFDVGSSDKQNSYVEAERIGSGIADTILQALPDLKIAEDSRMNVRQIEIEIPCREPFPEELQQAQQVLEKYRDLDTAKIGSGELNSEDLVKGVPIVLKFFAEKLMRVIGDNKTEFYQYTQIEIGNTIFVSLPGEPFCEIGLTLRKAVFEDKNAFILELGGGIITYIPNSYNYRRGGYETMIRSNRLSRRTDMILIEKITELNKTDYEKN